MSTYLYDIDKTHNQIEDKDIVNQTTGSSAYSVCLLESRLWNPRNNNMFLFYVVDMFERKPIQAHMLSTHC